MKFQVSMKNPDALDEAIQEAARTSLLASKDIDDDEVGLLMEHRCEKLRAICKQWFEHGEYLTVEIDTEANTCVVQREGR